MIKQGIRVPTVGRPQETATFAKRVEDGGFDFMWTPETPWLAGRWRDVYVHLTAAALHTERLRLGPGVTNPLTRHPLVTGSAIQAIDDVSGGRADLVVGTGYSSAYIIGRKAATLASMRAATELWRSGFSGVHTSLPGSDIELQPPCPDLPIYLAASGPKALQLAGEIGDGVLIMVGACAGAVGWALEQLDIGMQRAGRTRNQVKRFVVVTARVDDDLQRAIDEVRPAVASLYRHPAATTLLARAGREIPNEIPPLPDVYPDLGHAVDWEEAKRVSSYVPDAAVLALTAVGSSAAVAERTKALIELDIDGIWWRDEATYSYPEALMNALADDVLPRVREWEAERN